MDEQTQTDNSKLSDSTPAIAQDTTNTKMPNYFYILGIPAIIGILLLVLVTGVDIIILLVTPVLGYFLGYTYGKKNLNKSDGLKNFLAWSNVVSWLIPFIGFGTSLATMAFISNVEMKDRKKYIILGYIGLYLSLINAIYGALYAFSK